jgi:hypothetical protein
MILTLLIVVKVNGVHDANDDECGYEDDTVQYYTIHTLYWTRILF